MPMSGAVQEAVPAPPAAAPSADSKSSSVYTGGGSSDYSTTNVQEVGVDEADVIKNDGKYIYLIKGNNIRIVNAYPASEMKELISFQLGPQDEYFYPSDMYVDGDTLVAMGTASVSYPVPLADTVTSSVGGTSCLPIMVAANPRSTSSTLPTG
jgi:inhibitor of cysteine peptidase